MISEEKMVHVLHLMLDGLEKAKFVSYPNKDLAVREAKKVCFKIVSQMASVGDIARKRISTQKNPPPENSAQWDVLYRKYYEEEARKIGG
jgi:uncharacterized protein